MAWWRWPLPATIKSTLHSCRVLYVRLFTCTHNIYSIKNPKEKIKQMCKESCASMSQEIYSLENWYVGLKNTMYMYWLVLITQKRLKRSQWLWLPPGGPLLLLDLSIWTVALVVKDDSWVSISRYKESVFGNVLQHVHLSKIIINLPKASGERVNIRTLPD